MKCGMRTLSLTSLAFALIATGALSLAVATDYWLFTLESIYAVVLDGETGLDITIMVPTNIHSGLWRACIFHPDIGTFKTSVLSLSCLNKRFERNYYQGVWVKYVMQGVTNYAVHQLLQRDHN